VERQRAFCRWQQLWSLAGKPSGSISCHEEQRRASGARRRFWSSRGELQAIVNKKSSRDIIK
jgi:hypothetical protein